MRLLALCAVLAAGAALAQNNPPPMNNPPPAPAIQAPVNVPPPSLRLPDAAPAPPPAAVADPIARRLNLALGLAGGLRKELAEGRGEGERARRLFQELQKTLIGLRGESTVKDRTPGDEVWSRPLGEAQAIADEMAGMNLQFAALQDATQKVTRMFDRLSEASRKRHEVAQSSIRNVR